jgi:NADPH-dependent ferric siderophore reductase
VEQNLVSFIQVVGVRRITPHMVRVTFGGDGLDNFRTWPDQQLKLCFPRPGQTVPRLPEQDPDGDVMRWYQAYLAIPEDERPWMRSYTVRAYHPEDRTIDIDFVLHGDRDRDSRGRDSGAGDAVGPATRWARTATPGDVLGRYGPSEIYARPLGKADWLLLAGDETALPAIGTLVESLPAGARAVAYVEIGGPADEQRFESVRGEVTVHWVHRGAAPAGGADVLLEAVRSAEFPPGPVFAWLAGESGVVRALRRHLVQERGIDRRSVQFTGYWRFSLTQDDAPTEDDLAEARERLADVESPGDG